MANPRDVLGVPSDATEDDIKLAFRKLAMQYHPDRNPNNPEAEARFKDIAAAYEELRKNPNAGQQEHHGFSGFSSHGFSHPPGFDFDFRTGPHGFNFDDIFNAVHNRPRQQRNPDINVVYQITLEDAFCGKVAELHVRTGHGAKTVAINVPPGIDNGMRLRVSGQGERIYSNLPAGDLYVTIQVRAHPVFQRVAQNLMVEREITSFDAMLGAELELATIEGTKVVVQVPPGTQPGARLRIANHGMWVTGGLGRGDMIVMLSVRTPTNLSPEATELLQKCKDLWKN